VSIVLNTYVPRSRFAPVLPPKHTYRRLDPEVIQAVWRCMLGGNDHWVSYWSSDAKHSGLNDQQAALGRITKSGKDYRYRAGEPYDFTVEAVDAQKRGFGTWTRNGDATNPLSSYACWDFEPLKQPTKRKPKKPSPDGELTPAGSRINQHPTTRQKHRVYREAEACYNDAANLFLNDERILAGYLVESSPDHYHVGIIFSRSLPKDEHDQIVATINLNRFKNLDKDSSRAKRGIGTQFRAPFCWKHGVRSQCIKWYCRDTQQLIDRGSALRPPGLGQKPHRKSTYDTTIKDPTNPDTILAWAIEHYPIAPRTRHNQQRSLILSLLNRKIDPEIIRQIGPLWLAHFNNQADQPDTDHQNFRTDQAAAEALFNDRVVRTLKDPDLQLGSKSTYDYAEIINNYQLNPQQLDTIQQILQPQNQNQLSSPLRNGDDTSFWNLPVALQHSAYFIEAVIVQRKINRLKAEDGLRCTHQQLIDIIKQRQGVEIDPRQFQRVKMRFCSMPREGRSYHHASKIELLVETLKGTPGLPSEYEITPPLVAVLD
jgi:hypothetical protein